MARGAARAGLAVQRAQEVEPDVVGGFEGEPILLQDKPQALDALPVLDRARRALRDNHARGLGGFAAELVLVC